MNQKIIIFSILIFGAITLSACSQKTADTSKTIYKGPSADMQAKADKIEVINFHTTKRCVSCNNLGSYSEATIYEFFQPELRDGIISFQSINLDLPENREIAKKYQATGSSLFINSVYDGQDHIEEDLRVWRLLNSETQFKNYLKSRIDASLNK